MNLVKWRKGCRSALLREIEGAVPRLPDYIPGRGLGANWELPPLSTETAPIYVSTLALAALVAAYEEYVDRYLVTHDYSIPARRWLHENIPADAGVLEYLFPIISGNLPVFIAEVYLVRLTWLIQQCPGLGPVTSLTERWVNTTVGGIGFRGGRILYRFNPEGIPLAYPHVTDVAMGIGHMRVFNNALNRIYAALPGGSKPSLALLSTRTRTKVLLRTLYSDGLVTYGYIDRKASTDDKLLSIEQAVLRSKNPAETLQQVLVPDLLSVREYRTLFGIPWGKAQRVGITAEHLIRKMRLVRELLVTN